MYSLTSKFITAAMDDDPYGVGKKQFLNNPVYFGNGILLVQVVSCIFKRLVC